MERQLKKFKTIMPENKGWPLKPTLTGWLLKPCRHWGTKNRIKNSNSNYNNYKNNNSRNNRNNNSTEKWVRNLSGVTH